MQRAELKVVNTKERSAVEEAKRVLEEGGLLVSPTDTIYGILADALNFSAVKKLYRLRRPSRKPFIVLIPDLSWIGKLGLEGSYEAIRLLTAGPITLVLRKKTGLFHHLGRDTVAVRYPRRGFIFKLLRDFGKPVVAPSANPEGEPPVTNVKEAMEFFGDRIQLYVDGGRIYGKPSALITLSGDRRILRYGVYSDWSLKRLLSDLG